MDRNKLDDGLPPGAIRGGPTYRRGEEPAGVGPGWTTTRDGQGDVIFLPPPGYAPPPARPAEAAPMTAFRPNPLADYFDQRAAEEQSSFNKDFMYLPIHLGVGGVSLAQSRWPSGPFSRFMSRFLGYGNLGLAGVDIKGMYDSAKAIPEMKRAAEMWRSTGMPGSPSASDRVSDIGADPAEAERLFRLLRGPQVPVSR